VQTVQNPNDMQHSSIVGDAVIMENKIIRSQVCGSWPKYVIANCCTSVDADEAKVPCTLMPPDAKLHMIYISEQNQCYIVKHEREDEHCVFNHMRAEFWFNRETVQPTKHSLFCGFEFKTANEQTVLGLFDVLILNHQSLVNWPIFERVKMLHKILLPMQPMQPRFSLQPNVIFHFVGEQQSVLDHRNQNPFLQHHRAFQLRKNENSQHLCELVPLSFTLKKTPSNVPPKTPPRTPKTTTPTEELPFLPDWTP